MKLYGYARVSTKGQNNDRQVADITKYAESVPVAVTECFTEVVSGNTKNTQRPELTRLLAKVRRGDRVVVTEVSRLGRRTSEVLRTIEDLNERGVSVLALNYRLETLTADGKPNPMAQMLFTFLAEFARLERETLSERVKSGLDNARTLGRVGGRPTTATKSEAQLLTQYAGVVKRLDAGTSMRDTAKLEEVALGTVQKVARVLKAKRTLGKQLLGESAD